MPSPYRWALALSLWGPLVLGLAIADLMLCPATTCVVPVADRAVLQTIAVWRTPAVDSFFRTITWLGSIFVLGPIAILCTVALWRRHAIREARFVLAALGGAWLIVHVAKGWIERSRPELAGAITAAPADPSFPSAHAMQSFALGLALWLVVRRLRPESNLRAAVLLSTVVAAVSWSRLYLQVHYPSDVVAGLLAAGLWVAGLAVLLLDPSRRRRASSR